MNGQIILITIAVYAGVLVLIARMTGRGHTDNAAFFLANRQSAWYVVAFGMVGSSLSGVTFVSVPGLVRQIDMTYMQMVFGFIFGYIAVAKILLPLYYRLNLISIYSFLEKRIGRHGYKTGAAFFLLSKLVGAASRLYLVVWILQTHVFDQWRIPFAVTVIVSVLIVWLYTYRSGIRTILWTDVLQTFVMLAMLIAILWQVKNTMGLDMSGMMDAVTQSPHFRIFEWDNWGSRQHFVKQFFSGIFVTIVMTGLDQDMMQKNLSCRNLREAQKNMYWYGLAFTPLNFLFLCLGILLLGLAAQFNVALPTANDDIVPMFCASGMLGYSTLALFTVGIIAAAFNSADSALTALTTSFCIDFLQTEKGGKVEARRTRLIVHAGMAAMFVVAILIFKALNNRSLIDALYTIVSYTYGPLLGLFAFGLFTKRKTKDRLVPFICIASPVACFLLNHFIYRATGYLFGYELLMLNGMITFASLFFCSQKNNHTADTSFLT
ncbi:MAG: sodium:solute symporter [Tannerella sp.]|jgi:Na+/proline symporter|nr:sodium:solute symporter [Tannerella sp.]